MKRTHSHNPYCLDRTCLLPLATLAVLLLTLFLFVGHSRSPKPSDVGRTRTGFDGERYSSLPRLPRLAYLISGTRGDGSQVKRLLQAAYHPRNFYLLHLDFEALDSERIELARYAKSESAIREFRNVMVIGKADLVTYKGPTSIASTLHGVAVLLKLAGDWDWFVNLSPSDYPVMPQDDILHIFSYLPGDLNFIEHTSSLGWKEHQRARPIIVDPRLYHSKKSGVFWAKEKRSLPASFKLFMGSEWVMLSKSFLELCVWGWDNLPRTLLMYYTNFLSSQEGYFHTVICNHKDYQNTTVNHDLRYIRWDNPPKQNPINLTLEHFEDMIESGAPFARVFTKDHHVLRKIDEEILKRSEGRFTPGGWCIGNSAFGKDPCVFFGSPSAVKPSTSSRKLEKLVVKLLDSENFRSKQCK
ncbi:hypothetical protein K2173_001846 [Erythroxylum novogranatense]|uniref:Uncharacterized protein n=1 Tax=Erythroxylum novogranatense TaxID=1862640 RepID=A0AAV8SPP4_9ROSI|nr:hypothetical protein K2173_001846 [Erythroxylum novogranatense]